MYKTAAQKTLTFVMGREIKSAGIYVESQRCRQTLSTVEKKEINKNKKRKRKKNH